MNKIALSIHVSADDWTAERAIIASNGHCSRFDLIWQNFTIPDTSHFQMNYLILYHVFKNEQVFVFYISGKH